MKLSLLAFALTASLILPALAQQSNTGKTPDVRANLEQVFSTFSEQIPQCPKHEVVVAFFDDSRRNFECHYTIIIDPFDKQLYLSNFGFDCPARHYGLDFSKAQVTEWTDVHSCLDPKAKLGKCTDIARTIEENALDTRTYSTEENHDALVCIGILAGNFTLQMKAETE